MTGWEHQGRDFDFLVVFQVGRLMKSIRICRAFCYVSGTVTEEVEGYVMVQRRSEAGE